MSASEIAMVPSVRSYHLHQRTGLAAWVEDAPTAQEREARIIEGEKIIECFKENKKALHINNSLLTSLPPEIGLLSHLRVLGVSNTEIQALPEEIGNLKKLETLTVESNTKLSTLPASISELTNLTNINLQSNNLTSLPAGMERLRNLQYMDVRNNRLSSFPREMVYSKVGSTIRLEGNCLSRQSKTKLAEEMSKADAQAVFQDKMNHIRC